MTEPDRSNLETLDVLLVSLFEHGLSEEQWSTLRALIESDPAAREQYTRYVRTHAVLETEVLWPQSMAPLPDLRGRSAQSADLASGPRARKIARQESAPSLSDAVIMPAIFDEQDDAPVALTPRTIAPPPPPTGRERMMEFVSRSIASKRFRIAAAAVVVLSLTLTIVLLTRGGSEVATLVESNGSRWNKTVLAVGARLRSGDLWLQSGTARLQFDNGTIVTVQGPARFNPKSADSLALTEGTLAASISTPASGFTVVTPVADVVDLGTEFGVVVDAAGMTDVHVLSGRVAIRPESKSSPEQTLSAGSAMRVAPDQQVSDIPLEARTFAFAARDDAPSAYSRWMAGGKSLRADPSLVAYYTFENDSADASTIRNTASTGSKLDGICSSAKRSAGRFPGKQGLRFEEETDRVDLEFADTYQDVTLWTWIKPESIDRPYIALFASSDWAEPGSLHWNLYGTGQMSFLIYNEAAKKALPVSKEQPVRVSSSEWAFVAAVYKSDGTISLYHNGQPVGAKLSQAPSPEGVVMSRAQLGNWNGIARPFKGTMDEFGILSRAMSDQEIQRLYTMSKP